MEKKATKLSTNTSISEPYGNTKGNTKPSTHSMPQSGGPKTPPPPRGSSK